jgi:hypothetical protein
MSSFTEWTQVVLDHAAIGRPGARDFLAAASAAGLSAAAAQQVLNAGETDVVEPDAGVADRRAGIFTSRLHHQNVSARLREFAGNDRTGSTAANDDIVIRSFRL